MEILLTILILTLVVSLTSVLTRLSPIQIPLPLIQIAAGALLAQPIFGLHVEFNPELFLLLFIPPLLFAESSKIQPKELIKHSREIVGLALILVLITILPSATLFIYCYRMFRLLRRLHWLRCCRQRMLSHCWGSSVKDESTKAFRKCLKAKH